MSEDGKSSNEAMVLLPSGKLVPAPRLTLNSGAHKPEYVLEWLDKLGDRVPPRIANFKRKICIDNRMRDFWSWIGSIQFNRLDNLRNSLTVSDQIHLLSSPPAKPGDMTPNKRAAYFARIRTHATALRELLKDTRFDYVNMEQLDEAQLNRPLNKELWSWGIEEKEEGHTVAYQVTREGAFRHHYDYPDNVLTETLANVMEWTYWDDNWDGAFWGSSAPIAQSKSDRMPTIYFCCCLYDWFKWHGVEIPFSILATVANVALDLPADRLVDEDAARKQVRRYQKRKAEQAKGR